MGNETRSIVINQFAFTQNFPRLDIIDAAIVDCISRAICNRRLSTYRHNGLEWTWVSHNLILTSTPILRISAKTLERRLKVIVDHGIFNIVTPREHGCKCLVRTGDQYELTQAGKAEKVVPKVDYRQNVHRGIDKLGGYPKEIYPKSSSSSSLSSSSSSLPIPSPMGRGKKGQGEDEEKSTRQEKDFEWFRKESQGEGRREEAYTDSPSKPLPQQGGVYLKVRGGELAPYKKTPPPPATPWEPSGLGWEAFARDFNIPWEGPTGLKARVRARELHLHSETNKEARLRAS